MERAGFAPTSANKGHSISEMIVLPVPPSLQNSPAADP